MNLIEDKQILLAELLSNYNEILKFIKDRISEEDLDYYLRFFNKPSNKECIEISLWKDDF